VIPSLERASATEGGAMMGRRRRDQGKLFYEFNLDDMVPRDHLLRRMDVFVGSALADLHAQLKAFYSDLGRPSVDPELMIRMLLVGYCYGIRSERRLCQDVALHLAYRWFCRLDLEDRIPHHSTFSLNRLGRFRESDILRHVFERVVIACMAAGLVKGEGFAVDASVIEANASRYHGKAPNELEWTDEQKQRRAVAEYLAAVEAEAKAAAEAAARDADIWSDDDDEGDDPEPETPRRRKARRKAPKVISPSDPFSAWTAKSNKRVLFGYGLNYLVDVEHAVIIDVEATPARTYDEIDATRTMLDRTEARFDLKPKRLIADTAYGIGRFLGWLVKEKRITPHIPVWDKSRRDDGTFSRDDFTFDKKRRLYVCPAGKTLTTTGRANKEDGIRYAASLTDCRACPSKAQCCPNMKSRQITRDIDEDARDVARRKMTTKAFLKSRDLRKRVEMRFGHLKTHHGFERMRLRGLSGARDEFHLAATVQNLKTMALRLIRPPPEPAPA
jgi:transposase